MTQDPLSALEDKIGYHFKNRHLLERAMTHSSTNDDYNYERLEFLGDRVLGLVMAHQLFEKFRGESEGGLAKRHSALVQGRTLADIASVNCLGDHIIMSASERSAGGEKKDNLLADVLESLLGALYLDGGLAPAEKLILEFWGENIHTLEEAPQDPKTELQEWAQAKALPLPVYQILSREGPDHAPVFTVQVNVEGYESASAQGSTRRRAEKTAARKMLKQLKEEKA